MVLVEEGGGEQKGKTVARALTPHTVASKKKSKGARMDLRKVNARNTTALGWTELAGPEKKKADLRQGPSAKED